MWSRNSGSASHATGARLKREDSIAEKLRRDPERKGDGLREDRVKMQLVLQKQQHAQVDDGREDADRARAQKSFESFDAG